jgi:glycerol-3-phosphate acyltransferase PlsY
METAFRILGAAVGAYLIGSIPWAVIVVRVFWRQDIRTLGSGNTGATNVLRVFGTAPGIGVLLLDALKGAAGVWLAMTLASAASGASGADWMGVLGAMAAIAGHSFSPFIGFSGGKGVATAAGAIAMLAPWVAVVLLLTFVIVVAVGKIVSLGSIVIAVMFPGVSWLLYPDHVALRVFALIASALVIWRHRTNIGRIARREESKITFKRRMWDELRSRSAEGE